MQLNNVENILKRINRKLNQYCPKSQPKKKPYYLSQHIVTDYKNAKFITQKYINQQTTPIVPTPQNNMRQQLQQHKKVINELKGQNLKLISKVQYLQKRVKSLQRRAQSESVNKKKSKNQTSKISSRQQIQSSFYSNCLSPKLKKRTIKQKKKK